MTQSLRARNPSVRVANSIYDPLDQTCPPFTHDAASIVAPSELEFEFDNMVINSQAYRRAIAYAKAKTKPFDSQAEHSLSDLIDLTDSPTIREGGTATAAIPAVLQELQELTLHEPPARKQTADYSGIQTTERSSATGELVNDTTMVVAEPEEVPTTCLMGHSRSITPTELVRPENKFENSGPKRCRKCGGVLTGEFLRVTTKDEYKSSKLFHFDCFRCAVCPQIHATTLLRSRAFTDKVQDCTIQIASKSFPLDDIFLCETDYFRRFDQLCSACGKALRGKYITVNDKKFHLDHFGCEAPGCHVVFGQEDSYFDYENKQYYKLHYSHMYAPLYTSCDCPILDQSVEVERGGTLQQWHDTCYMLGKFLKVRMKPVTCGRLEHTAAGWIDKFGNPIGEGEFEQILDSVSHDIHRIWSVISTFKETCAKHISDIRKALSSSPDYASFIPPARALLHRTATLFHVVQHVAEFRKLQDS
jgi:hypothetical protein